MAEKTIKHASFWYANADGVNETALRGDTVDIPGEADIKRGERLGAFATEDDLAEGAPFAQFVARRDAALAPGVVSLDPADVEGRISPAGSADPAINSGMVDPATVTKTTGGASVQVPASTTSTSGAGTDKAPAGNASRDEWAAHATSKGAPEEETKPQDQGGLSRDDLRTKYGN